MTRDEAQGTAERTDPRHELGQSRYRPALIAYFLRRIRHPADAEDLTQEVLTRVLEMGEGQVERSDSYIFTVASNLLKDRFRRQQVRDAWRSEAQAVGPHADVIDPMRLLEARETLGVVARAVEELPLRTREILLLFRLEHMRKRDIAEKYGVSVSAVDKHLIRATAYVARRLEEGE